eukprot:scaffold7.g3440.t1
MIAKTCQRSNSVVIPTFGIPNVPRLRTQLRPPRRGPPAGRAAPPRAAAMSAHLYRQTKLGDSLVEALDQLVEEGKIPGELALKVMQQGQLDVYRYCDNVWTFILSNALLRIAPTASAARREEVELNVDQLKMVLVDENVVHRGDDAGQRRCIPSHMHGRQRAGREQLELFRALLANDACRVRLLLCHQGWIGRAAAAGAWTCCGRAAAPLTWRLGTRVEFVERLIDQVVSVEPRAGLLAAEALAAAGYRPAVLRFCRLEIGEVMRGYCALDAAMPRSAERCPYIHLAAWRTPWTHQCHGDFPPLSPPPAHWCWPSRAAAVSLTSRMGLRVGIDVGGTNTDCALVAGDGRVRGCSKSITTDDVVTGVEQALALGLQDAGAAPSEISAVMLGTTQFVNAAVQRRGLAPVAVLRLCGPATRALPPFCDLPPDLRHTVACHYEFLPGTQGRALTDCQCHWPPRGLEYDGCSPIAPLDERAVREGARRALAAGARTVVVSGVFSPLAAEQEEQVGELVRGGPAGEARGRVCGGAWPAAFWSLMPVATFQSGPVNSLRGAAFLTGLQNAVVVDIGGTTTDVGAIVRGLPHPAARNVRLAGVVTNFPMPDVMSIGLGGGSLVRFGSDDGAGAEAQGAVCSVGPDSVGARLLEEAACLGGGAATGTDVAVALGRLGLGSRAAAAAALGEGRAEQAWHVMQDSLERCVDAMKTQAALTMQAGDVPVIVVGGGAPLCGDSLAGASRVVRPVHAAVANAVGAAIPQVSGSVDMVVQLGSTPVSRAAALATCEAQAVARAEAAGAAPGSCEVVVREEIPLAYMPGDACRVVVKAVGELRLGGSQARAATSVGCAPGEEEATPWPGSPSEQQQQQQPPGEPRPAVPPIVGRPYDPPLAQLAAWEPQLGPDGAWLIWEPDLYLIAIGTGILGTGERWAAGSGPGSMCVVSPATLPDDALVFDAGFMGAPTVGIEKLDSHQAEAAANGEQRAAALPSAACGRAEQHGEPTLALLATEIGGCNGIEPLCVGARMGLPVVDADLMGRAFPELHMVTSCICGLPVTPAAIADEKGNAVAVLSVQSAAWLERLLRPLCTDMGCSAGFSSRPLTGEELRRVAVCHSLSFAFRLGSAVARAQAAKADAPAAAASAGGGCVLFEGKVVDVERRTTGGFARGSLRLNENLVAQEGERMLACVPDLICCLETQTGLPVATEEVRYGLRLSVVGLPAHPLLRSAEALTVVGPAAFGLDVAYQPLGPYVAPRPVPMASAGGRGATA